jgi:hypothetical protein
LKPGLPGSTPSRALVSNLNRVSSESRAVARELVIVVVVAVTVDSECKVDVDMSKESCELSDGIYNIGSDDFDPWWPNY